MTNPGGRWSPHGKWTAVANTAVASNDDVLPMPADGTYVCRSRSRPQVSLASSAQSHIRVAGFTQHKHNGRIVFQATVAGFPADPHDRTGRDRPEQITLRPG